MLIDTTNRYAVAVIGAGPAGLFGARELAEQGIQVVLFNRDIKPGGLAEYGIYPTKTKMKEGLRNQFRQILTLPGVDYYGHVLVGDHGDIRLDDLRALGFQAMLVTVGAQGTKRTGIPGEDLLGVYHAKDIVYHYNALPPFGEMNYQIGKRVAVIGVGNVMVDITHWLTEEKGVDEVVAVARRGPGDIKFDRRELETVVTCINVDSLDAELKRVAPRVQAVGQDPGVLMGIIEEGIRKMSSQRCNTCFTMRFLSSPVQVLGDDNGRVIGLEVEENELVLSDDGATRPVGTGRHSILDVDTVIFAIGDLVDSEIGLPVEGGEYAKNPQPRFPVEGVSYEAYDPETGRVIPDVFFAGWARKPSTGLVGLARKDAIRAAIAVRQYLETVVPGDGIALTRARRHLMRQPRPVVSKLMLRRLEALERERGSALNLEGYRFTSDQQMLEALDLVAPLHVRS